MSQATKVLIVIWIVIGLPLLYALNFWTREWFNPFVVDDSDKSISYLIHIVVVVLCYGIPIYVVVNVLLSKIRKH